MITLIVAALVAAAASVITIEWERYAKVFGWTFRWGSFLYGVYLAAGTVAGLLFVVVFEYLFGAKPEPGTATWLAGVGFGLAGAAAMRADLSRVPEAGEALVAIKKLGAWVDKAIDHQILVAVAPRLEKLPPGPFARWVKYACQAYGQDSSLSEEERKATIDRVNGYLDRIANPAASEENKLDARDAVILEVEAWVVTYKLRHPSTRERKMPP